MKARIITFIKFIILVAIFYALLAFNVFHLWEKLVPSTKDYLNTNVPTGSQDLEQNYMNSDIVPKAQTGHFAASNINDLASLCASISICDKIHFNGNFTDTEKYGYIKVIDKIIAFIDTNSPQIQKMEQVLSDIEVNKENGNRRWYATHDTIIFNLWAVQSQKEFIELSTHEMGHITDLGYIQWTSSKKDKNYTEFGKAVFAIDDISLSFYKLSRNNETIRKAEAKKKDFCSGYGMSDPFEDFAECFNLYINHNIFFRQVSKTDAVMRNKYNFIASVFNGKYINSNIQDLTLIKADATRRPRDTTKLSN